MVVENLCLLAYKGITQVDYTDNRPKELLDYFLEGSMGLEVIGKIKMLRTEGMVDEGIVLLEYRLPDCNPQVGTGDLCQNDASKAKAVQKITEKIDFSKFKTYKSNEVPLSTVGTIHDFCRIDGKQTAYLDFAYNCKQKPPQYAMQWTKTLPNFLQTALEVIQTVTVSTLLRQKHCLCMP
jgi:hypothetical protein